MRVSVPSWAETEAETEVEGEEIEVWGGREEGATLAVGTCEWCGDTGGSGGYREHSIVLHYCMCANMYSGTPRNN